jgi:hypothetical protein
MNPKRRRSQPALFYCQSSGSEHFSDLWRSVNLLPVAVRNDGIDARVYPGYEIRLASKIVHEKVL